jgi:hypothetical protein
MKGKHMRRARLLIVAGALLASIPLVGVGAAGATPAFGARLLGPVVIDKHDPGVAYVHATYMCDKAPTAAWHLWVSLKQNDKGTRDPALSQGGSSSVAATWLQRHPVRFECDGDWHTRWFTINTVEQGFGQAVDGTGWLQFCLIDFGDASMQRAAILQTWRDVDGS